LEAPKVILVGGGCRSGKSRFALELGRRLGQRRVFLATAEAGDDEMRARIDLHRQTRGSDYRTVEEPLALPEVLRPLHDADVVVIDCLTLWLSNLLLASHDAAAVLGRVDDLAAVLAERAWHSVVVTNEVGLGIVPESALGRTFRDVAGSAHQRLAQTADEIYLAILGTILRIKPTLACVGPGGASE
jgi:adenosylcobinamide kinase/adenosylcobinamide-phosphate guanylyltransferase